MKIKKTPEQRFWKNVRKDKNCWTWIGSKDSGGYGRITINEKSIGAHRYSFIIHKGDIVDIDPKNRIFVCHSCDNPSCVNPRHLFLGTPKDNTDDMYDKYYKSEEGKLIIKRNKIIESLFKEGFSFSDIAYMFNVAHTTIIRIIKKNV